MQNIPNFVAVDLETTGLDFEKDEIIEVALVRFENGEPTESVDYLVKPSQAKLRPFIETLTGISQVDLDGAEDFASLAGNICSFVGDLPLVAHNASFDSKFLKQTFSKVGISYDNHLFWDSLTLSRIAFQEVSNHRLETLVQALGIERSRAHRALPDADACGRLFVKACQKVFEMDSWVVNAIARIAVGSDYSVLFGEPQKPEFEAPEYAFPEMPKENQTLAKNKMARVSEFFKDGGILSNHIENYKVREDQQDFSSVVERNMHKGGLCILEAPTGSGKTIAYLVAAANKAVSGERVVISTATRTLQEQLWKRDIPQIAPAYNGLLKPAILKGRDNYISFIRFEEILRSPATLLSQEERDSFMALIPWAVSTKTGDINECTSFNHHRNRVLWSKVCSCASRIPVDSSVKDPALYAKRCAMNANLVLVNHALFLSDLSLDFAVLPAYEHVVFDEAHRLPEASSMAQGRSVSFFGYRNVAKTLVPSRNNRDGLIAEIQARLATDDTQHREACEQLIFNLSETEKALHRFFMKIGKKLGKMKIGRNGFAYKKGILAEYDVDPKTVLEQFACAKKCADELFAALSGFENLKGIINDAYCRLGELERFFGDFEFAVRGSREDWVFYLEEPFNPHTIKMLAYPLHCNDIWKNKFYPWVKSATFTSATLAVQGDLAYYTKKMGMDSLEERKRPFMRIYAEKQVNESRRKVIVAKFMPKPTVQEAGDALNSALVEILPNLAENSMVLFTSIASMMKAQAALAPVFAEKQKLLLCQHVDGALDGLVSMFRKSRGACLLGCQSLWEGVDFPGDALKHLVITKLPFPNPSEPLVAGVANEMKARGENSFKDYFMPEAYMQMRQGFGRLIRSEEDSGSVIILDSRVVTEPYGKAFTRIWGQAHKVANSLEEIKEMLG